MGKREAILIVDDMKVSRVVLRGLFEGEYNLLEAENGAQALLLLEQYQDCIACVLLDLVMPVKDGYQVLTEMAERGNLTQIPVVIITAGEAGSNEVRALEMGASDLILKPFEPSAVRHRVHNLIELHRHRKYLEELVDEQAQVLRNNNERMLDTLSSIIEYRSAESGQHIRRIRMFTKILLEEVAHFCYEYDLDGQKIEMISSASAMHDAGKIAIPDAILNKPGRLTAEEFEVMKAHAAQGCEMLQGMSPMGDKQYLQYICNIARYHHERWDGGGYPDGLRGDNIPICAQVVGIADCYDALTTDRVYKRAYSNETALNMILNGECGAFSPKLLECLKNVREDFKTLAQQYADGGQLGAEQICGEPTCSRRRSNELDTMQWAEVKYFSMLRHLDATVVEVDLDNGIYHMVYTPNQDFELLRTGGTFLESMARFVEGVVHPEDREVVGAVTEVYMRNFFEEGRMRQSRRYRVRMAGTDCYRWYRATILRLDIDAPHHHRAIVVWEQEREARMGLEQGETDWRDVARILLNGLCQCRNDRNLTVVQCNEGFQTLTGYSLAELREQHGGRLLRLVPPEERSRLQQQIREQLYRGRTAELEFRVRRKNGDVLWLLCKAILEQKESGAEYLYCNLVDATQTKQAREELRLSLERHQIIMNQSNDIIFEWDIKEDVVIYSSNWEKKFGYEPIRTRVCAKIPVASHLFPDDVPLFMEQLTVIRAGAPYGEIEVRIAKADGRYLWCRIRATAQTNGRGENVKAVGVVLDIDAERRASQALIERAERDGLTRLYNKSSARRRIEQYLSEREEDERGALFIVDVDNFKQINDRYGHMYGDAVLAGISEEIRKLFRSGDIISRIGGDEFMIVLKSVPSSAVVTERAERLIHAFQGQFQEGLADCRLSCSVGVALVPEHGRGYQELFQKADQALYQAKRQGKNRFLVYDGPTLTHVFSDTQSATAVSARIDSDHQSPEESDLARFAFQQLNESGDMEQAISTILALAGRQYNVSRAYIFEDTPDGAACCNTFEWCNHDVQPEQDALQYVRYQELGGNYQDNFDENGIFYCPDVSKLSLEQYAALKPQGIRSMLQCAIRDGGRFRGFVGFDECSVSRMWTQAQIDALTFLAALLSVFLLKKRAQDEVEKKAADLRNILDSQNAWVYIIDPDTYELRYTNACTRANVPDARIGAHCYAVFEGRETACPGCPVSEMRAGGWDTPRRFHPPRRVWAEAEACPIHWDGKGACLITCHDTPQLTPQNTVTTEKETI